MAALDQFHGPVPLITVENGLEAMDWYGRAFGAEKLNVMATKDRHIAHALMKAYNCFFMFNDNNSWNLRPPKDHNGTTCCLIFYVPDCHAAIDRAVAAGAVIVQPPEDYFWGERSARVRDPWGHHWAFSQRLKRPTPEELEEGWERYEAKLAAQRADGSEATA